MILPYLILMRLIAACCCFSLKFISAHPACHKCVCPLFELSFFYIVQCGIADPQQSSSYHRLGQRGFRTTNTIDKQIMGIICTRYIFSRRILGNAYLLLYCFLYLKYIEIVFMRFGAGGACSRTPKRATEVSCRDSSYGRLI